MKYIFPKSIRTSEEQEIIERAVINRALQCAKTEKAPHCTLYRPFTFITTAGNPYFFTFVKRFSALLFSLKAPSCTLYKALILFILYFGHRKNNAL